MTTIDRRTFIKGTALAGAATLTMKQRAWSAADDFDPIRKEIAKRHDETLKRLQEWIHQPSIAAENNGMNEGCQLTMRMLKDAGAENLKPGLWEVTHKMQTSGGQMEQGMAQMQQQMASMPPEQRKHGRNHDCA
jgi:hypothetical protein